MKNSKRKYIPEHYDSIDAPVYVWNKIHDTGDLSYLLVKRKKLNKKLVEVLEKAWEKIYDEYVREFGFSETFLSIKEKEMEVAMLKLDYISTSDGTLLTSIQIEEQQLSHLKKGLGKGGSMEAKIAIERRFKFQINMMTTSIKEFYSYLENLK